MIAPSRTSRPHLSDEQLRLVADASVLDPKYPRRRDVVTAKSGTEVDDAARSHLMRCSSCQERLGLWRAESLGVVGALFPRGPAMNQDDREPTAVSFDTEHL